MNRLQILQEIDRLNEEIKVVKQNPETPQEHDIFIAPILDNINRLKAELKELKK